MSASSALSALVAPVSTGTPSAAPDSQADVTAFSARMAKALISDRYDAAPARLPPPPAVRQKPESQPLEAASPNPAMGPALDQTKPEPPAERSDVADRPPSQEARPVDDKDVEATPQAQQTQTATTQNPTLAKTSSSDGDTDIQRAPISPAASIAANDTDAQVEGQAQIQTAAKVASEAMAEALKAVGAPLDQVQVSGALAAVRPAQVVAAETAAALAGIEDAEAPAKPTQEAPADAASPQTATGAGRTLHPDRSAHPIPAIAPEAANDAVSRTDAPTLADAQAAATPSANPAAPAATADGPALPTAAAQPDAAPTVHAATTEVAHQTAATGRDLSLSTLSHATVETTAHLAAQIARRLEGRSTRFDMVLTPEDLGRVDVSLEIGSDGQLAARLAFDNPAAAAELRGRADELRRQLQDAGFQVAGDALDFSQRDPSAGGGGFARQQQRAALFDGGARLASEADAVSLPAPGAWTTLSQTPDRVDLKV
ncbi:flagellar hook-length control protein FliK [Brevundimonas sp. SORGH_AS_0993]|uniref:flagellar hook-length control protein FliK n=1 Tax=Brevundimonas sp. SORGH_AS_0993 TaxID=3041794 RepID=UPI0027824150|nr:flagellar hook-length control protein FliK [Brevundimonas sp. SORGH_AS_0993]MDQ1153008.1 hypothetical protein [Brevundimonas sp. SORGH_AS_0993]